MSTATTAKEIDRDADFRAQDELLREVRDHLHRIQRRLNEEIRAYPTPIPRCDAQFNHLFEQRGRLYRALEAIEAPSDQPPSPAECVKLIDEFAASAAYVEDPAEDEIRARIRSELSRLGR